MKFKFIMQVFDSARCELIPRDAIRELTREQAELYSGRAKDHLAPLDEEAKAFLADTPSQATTSEPTRAELVEKARAIGVKNASTMKKEELQAALAEKD